jgi:23S rRNA pseudouridine2605 synthase
MVRLQKLLAQAGVASRRGAEELIAEGGVTVNGRVVTTLGVQVDERRDRVEVRGRRVMAEDPLYRILLKPRQCLSSLSRPSADDASPDGPRPTLARYVSDRELGWQVVAPLDFLSEGVVLLTTDGALAERMSRGGGHVSMTYHLKFQGALGESELSRLTKGWSFNGRPVRPTKIEALATTGKNTWIEMIVPESRPRALKSAGEAINHQLLKISRVRLGEMSFEGLKMGGWRDLTNGEITSLRSDAASRPDRNPGKVSQDFGVVPSSAEDPAAKPVPAKRRFAPGRAKSSAPASRSDSPRSDARDGRAQDMRRSGSERSGFGGGYGSKRGASGPAGKIGSERSGFGGGYGSKRGTSGPAGKFGSGRSGFDPSGDHGSKRGGSGPAGKFGSERSGFGGGYGSKRGGSGPAGKFGSERSGFGGGYGAKRGTSGPASKSGSGRSGFDPSGDYGSKRGGSSPARKFGAGRSGFGSSGGYGSKRGGSGPAGKGRFRQRDR